MSEEPAFGYPEACTACQGLSSGGLVLSVKPFYRPGGTVRVMLIGQDPTIANKGKTVSEVLMLNESGSRLTLWLKQVFGPDNYDIPTLYATNLVKCSFPQPPSTQGGMPFLEQYFNNCKKFLGLELQNYRPHLVIVLGEPGHRLFLGMLSNAAHIPSSLRQAFSGELFKARINDLEFDYSPCPHITTYHTKAAYQEPVAIFRNTLAQYLSRDTA